MKKAFLPILVVMMISSCKQDKLSAPPTEGLIIHGNKYVLDWSDEFDYSGLPDSTKWSFETGYQRNNETQWYTDKRPENCRVENGKLLITALNDSFEGHPVTSASIETKGIKNFQYGLIEVRAKMPHLGSGTWPAIWTLGANEVSVGWPHCGEIDIMEWVGKFPLLALGSVYAQGPASANYAERHWAYVSIKTETFTDEFHNYAIEWDSTQIKYYVDNANYVTYTKADLGKDWEPFSLPQFLKLNLAMGGEIPPLGGGGTIDYTKFPYTFEIEYARYYKRVE
jgi:beta-glucanase (GH16 family)